MFEIVMPLYQGKNKKIKKKIISQLQGQTAY